jgi:glutathione S-transferase
MPRVEKPFSPLVGKLRGVHLFHFDPTPCSQRVRFALAEKGLRRGDEVRWNSDAPRSLIAAEGMWASRLVSLIRKDHLTEEYAAIQPNLVVPALVHDGRLYLESMDIVKYIDETWPHPHLIPADPVQAALANNLVEQGKALHISVRYVSFRWGLGRLGRLGGKEEAALRRLEPANSPEGLLQFYMRYNRGTIEEAKYLTHLRALEGGYERVDRLLASDGRPFLVGESFCIADIIWSCKVLRIAECGYPFRRNFPALFEWYSHVSRRPAFADGVLRNHRMLSTVFKIKAGVANLLGSGLKRAGRESFAVTR